jgi:hypothetical protein
MNAVYQAHPDQFTMLAIAVDQQQDPLGYARSNGFKFDVCLDVDGAQTYSVHGIPTTLFIDRQGNLVDTKVGGMSRDEFESELAKIL